MNFLTRIISSARIIFLPTVLFQTINENNLVLTTRDLSCEVLMCYLNLSPWSRITPSYLLCDDDGNSSLLCLILNLSLVSCIRFKKEWISIWLH